MQTNPAAQYNFQPTLSIIMHVIDARLMPQTFGDMVTSPQETKPLLHLAKRKPVWTIILTGKKKSCGLW